MVKEVRVWRMDCVVLNVDRVCLGSRQAPPWMKLFGDVSQCLGVYVAWTDALGSVHHPVAIGGVR